MINTPKSIRNKSPVLLFYCLMEGFPYSSAIRAIYNQRHLLVSIWSMTWRRAPIGPSSLCWPGRSVSPSLRVKGVLSSRTDSVIALLSSWILNKILQKHIHKLAFICGRANLSKQSIRLCLHWFNVLCQFCITLRGVAAAVSLFVNRETAMLYRAREKRKKLPLVSHLHNRHLRALK